METAHCWDSYRNGSERKRAMFFMRASSLPSSVSAGSTNPLGWSVMRSPRMRKSGAESWRSSSGAMIAFARSSSLLNVLPFSQSAPLPPSSNFCVQLGVGLIRFHTSESGFVVLQQRTKTWCIARVEEELQVPVLPSDGRGWLLQASCSKGKRQGSCFGADVPWG